MWIPNHLQEQIKERAEITEVVGHFVTLKRAVGRYKALCPFHAERSPSFYVSPSKGIFKCFGCGKGGDAIHFLMEHERMTYPEALEWVAGFYKIPLENGGGYFKSDSPRQYMQRHVIPQLPPSFVELAVFQKSLAAYERNNLVNWFCKKINPDVVMAAVKAYHIGTAKDGKTIFWQVNIEGKAGTGHVIAYPQHDHRRIKSINPTWVHTLLNQSDEAKFNWVKYWFGEHLLAKHLTHTVAIVESEKTALVASIYLSHLNFVWLASCGKDGVNNRDKWKVLKGRKIVLYPDLSPPDERGQTPFQQWQKVAAEMQLCGYDVSVNDFLESHADEFERAQKWDLADFLLRRERSEFQTTVAAGRTMVLSPSQSAILAIPAVKELVARFDLKFEGIQPL